MAHAHHHHSPLQVSEEHRGFRRGAAFIIGGLTSGHGVFHWLTQSFIVVLPEVRDLLLGGSVVATTSIQTTREIASGVVSLPGGVLTDALRKHWGWVMAVCMALFGVGWILMAAGGWTVPGSSWLTAEQSAASQVSGDLNVLGYILLLVGMAVVGMAASFWHLPAVAALSTQFSHRRASVLSFHGVGGNVGDVIGPVLTGLLLSVLTWQGIITIYGAVPIFLAFLVFWAFRDIGQHRHGEEQQRPASTMRHQIDETKILMHNGRMWGITAVAGLRGMAYIGFITVLPLYLADELGLRMMDGEGGFENLFYRGFANRAAGAGGHFCQPGDGLPVGPLWPETGTDTGDGGFGGADLPDGITGGYADRYDHPAGGPGAVPVQRPTHPYGHGHGHCAGRNGGHHAGPHVHVAVHLQRHLAADCGGVVHDKSRQPFLLHDGPLRGGHRHTFLHPPAQGHAGPDGRRSPRPWPRTRPRHP